MLRGAHLLLRDASFFCWRFVAVLHGWNDRAIFYGWHGSHEIPKHARSAVSWGLHRAWSGESPNGRTARGVAGHFTACSAVIPPRAARRRAIGRLTASMAVSFRARASVSVKTKAIRYPRRIATISISLLRRAKKQSPGGEKCTFGQPDDASIDTVSENCDFCPSSLVISMSQERFACDCPVG